MIRIGVLALQGAVNEHLKALQAPDVETVVVKKAEQLNEIDGLVFPGGESTTMRRLIDKYEFFEPLKKFAQAGNPVFGTCAGAILMAKDLVGDEQSHLEVMDISVKRNAFGRQRESFEVMLTITAVGDAVEAVFIRAPIIYRTGPNVRILAEYDEQIVACQEGPLLACSFHPELTDDNRLHQYFVQMIRESKVSA